MLRKILPVFVGVCMFFSVSMANDEIMKTPKMDIVQSKIIYSNEDYMIGMMKVKNNTDAYFPEVYYNLGLVSYEVINEEEDIAEACIVGRNKSVKFSIGANQEKSIYFTYDIPKYLPEYVDELAVTFSTRTMQLGDSELSIILDKDLGELEGGFLLPNIEDELAVWEIGEEVVRADTGPNITTSSKPVAKMSLKSTFNTAITVTPKITIYQRSMEYNDKPVLTKTGDKIKFSANEEKTVKLNIPVVTTPDSYLIKIEFCNEKGEVVSHEYDFRYVVEGINGKIIESYLTDNEDELKLNVFASGPADSKNKLTDATLNCKIEAVDGANTVLFEENFKANLGSILGRKIIPLERYNTPINITLKLEKNGTIFDKVSFIANLNNLTSNDLEFLDITDAKIKEAVGVLNAIGMLNGYPDGTFRPNNNITRAEFTVIATRLAGLEVTSKQLSVFYDVPEDHWAKDYINLAQANGCISGYGDGSFKPNNNVTIAESITILVNVLNYRDKAINSKLIWPLNYLEVAEEFGLKDGVMYGSYMEPATRGKVSIMTLNSYLHKLSKGGN